MKIFLIGFVAIVVLAVILGSIYISLPSKVLGDLEEKLLKKDEGSTQENPERSDDIKK